MPIVTFHLVDGTYSDAQLERLLAEGSRLYSRVLDSPLDRVRAFVRGYPPERVAVGGELVARTGRAAPYFEFLMLAGRPDRQRLELLSGFTELLVEVLGADRGSVRGRAVVLDPEHWAIGGEPASARRAAEIQARGGAA
jgi:phenylpyruvate tautomerase PptA (4-oxalocrotonate tautomerase family)